MSNGCLTTGTVNPQNETLPSSLSNFISDFYGGLTKVVVDGKVEWQLPCNLSTGIASNPREAGEGLACYILRLADETLYGVPTSREVLGTAGITGGGDLSVDRTFSLDSVFASKAILPMYDALQYGVVVGNADAAIANSTALAALTSIARTSGRGIQLPAGRVYIAAPWDVSALTEVRGWGTIGQPVQTEIVTVVPGSNALVNVTGGTTISNLSIRPRYLRGVKTDNSSIAIVTQAFQTDLVIEDVVVTGFWRGIDAHMYDSSINRVTINGCSKPLRIRSSGYQNLVSRVTCRGSVAAVLTDSTTDTRVTCSSYTAGSSSFTVSDGTAFSAGDLIRVEATTSFGSSLSSQLWWRRVTGVVGNVVTISTPWSYSFSNASFSIGLGSGGYGVEVENQCVFSSLNVEWGVWDSVLSLLGPAMVSIDGLHVEGWGVYAPGIERYMIRSVGCVLAASYINAVSGSVLDAAGVSLFDSQGGYQVQFLNVRAWDLWQASKLLHLSKTLDVAYPYGTHVDAIEVVGVPFVSRPSLLAASEARPTEFHAGEDSVLVSPRGLRRRTFYGYSAVPTTGSFLAGDRIELASGSLICATSGSFRTPAGSGKIRSGSSVYIVDNTARGFLGVRTPVSIGGTVFEVVQTTRTPPPVTTTLTANALAGDTQIEVGTPVSLALGDWLVLDFAGVFEDVQIQGILGTTVFLSLPLASPHASGSTVEVGYKLGAASATDVLALAPIAVTAPTFFSEVGNFSVGGNASVGGSASVGTTLSVTNSAAIGNASTSTALQLTGSAVGTRALRLTRPSVGDVGIGVGAATFNFYDEATNSGVAQLSGGSSGSFHRLLFGAVAVASPKLSYVQGQASVGTDVAGGGVDIRAGAGTGAGTRATVSVSVPALTSSGATTQTHVTAARWDALETTDAGTMLVAFWNGAAWVEKRVFLGASDSGGTGYRMLRVLN